MQSMEQIKKNTVKADGQLEASPIKFCGGDAFKLLFIGNSITMHGYRPSIGWYGDNYGMAASSESKDYVHILMDKIKRIHPNAGYCILQVAEWEFQGHYKEGIESIGGIDTVRDYKPDIIVIRFVENCPQNAEDNEIFKKIVIELVEYLKTESSKIIITTSFWHHPLDDALRESGRMLGCPVIELGDLGDDESMKAIGLFEHDGVANHPGDLGMQTIAERIYGALFS